MEKNREKIIGEHNSKKDKRNSKQNRKSGKEERKSKKPEKNTPAFFFLKIKLMEKEEKTSHLVDVVVDAMIICRTLWAAS